MPDYMIKALFVFTGLLLIRELWTLAPAAGGPGRRAALHAVMGLCALLTSNAVGRLFGAGLGLNALTLPVSAGLGVPGVVVLWAIRYLL